MGRPPTDSSRVATPERILEAAEREFAEHGYAAARLEDIALRAGIRRPSLLYHFDSKESLYAATVARSFERMGSALTASLGGPAPFPARIDAFMGVLGRFLVEHPHLAPLVVREVIAVRGPGRTLLLERAVPLLDAVEAAIRHEGAQELRRDVSVRQALVQVGSSIFLAAAAGDLREPLWGPGDASVSLLRILLLVHPDA